MLGYIQNSTTSPTCSLNDTKFKLMMINRTKKTDNCNAAIQCCGSICAKVKQQKEKLVNTSSTQKFLCGPKLDYFQELEWETVEFVHL
jgi:hypothetical protein